MWAFKLGSFLLFSFHSFWVSTCNSASPAPLSSTASRFICCLPSPSPSPPPPLLQLRGAMALSISRRILRSFGSSCAFNHYESLRTSNALYGNTYTFGDSSSLGSSSLWKNVLNSRRMSTSLSRPESSGVATPSERKVGLYQDLVIPVTNFHNEDKGLMVLAGDVFDVPIRKDIVHRTVLWQLAKRRQGTHSTKTISEVSGTGRKPWPQKGTGRARHGTLRGPQFRGGCVMHGPKPRSYAIKLQKKVRRLGLKIALTARAAEGKLLIFEDLEIPTHKTKYIVDSVKQMEDAKKVLLVDGGPISETLKLATKNLYYVNVLPSVGLNVYSILQHDTLVMSRDAVNKIVERMHTPINR